MPGLPVKPLVYVKRVYVPLEQQFKYLSDESSSEDEEWTEGPIKKKDDPTASKGNYSFVRQEKRKKNCLMSCKFEI